MCWWMSSRDTSQLQFQFVAHLSSHGRITIVGDDDQVRGTLRTVQYSTVQYCAVQRSTVQYSTRTAHCRTIQHSTAQYRVREIQ